MIEPCTWCPAPGICSRWKRPGECDRHREQRERAGLAPSPTAAATPEQKEQVRRWKAELALIEACEHFRKKGPEDPGECGCAGTCTAGRGDLPEGRTSSNNCHECVRAGELDTPDRDH